MALRKAELDEINQELQIEIRRLRTLDAAKLEQENLALREENERLIDTLGEATERLQQLEELFNNLSNYVAVTVDAIEVRSQ